MNTLHVDDVRGDVVTYRVIDRYGQTVSAGEQRIHRARRDEDLRPRARAKWGEAKARKWAGRLARRAQQ